MNYSDDTTPCENHSIPVFLHEPKCGGTYVTSSVSHTLHKNIGQIAIHHIVSNEGFVHAKFSATSPGTEKTNITEDNFFGDPAIINRIWYFTICSHGFAHYEKYISYLKQYKPLDLYVTIRDPFSKQQSIYNYLNAIESKHELTHGNLSEFKTLNNFLPRVPSSWIISELANKIEQPINENDYLLVLNILKSYNIFDVSDSHKCVEQILSSECLKNRIKKIYKGNYNRSKTNAIKFEEVEPNIQQRFLRRSYWDLRLYEELLSKYRFRSID